MAYVNLEELGKGALSRIPQVENLVGGQITGAAAMSLTAQPDGLRMKAVLVDTPPMTDQKAYTPTLMKNAPADSVAYLGFNRLADTVEQALKSAESSSSADTKKQIDTVLAQAPLLLGVRPGLIEGSFVDLSDAQWRSFREALPLLCVVAAASSAAARLVRASLLVGGVRFCKSSLTWRCRRRTRCVRALTWRFTRLLAWRTSVRTQLGARALLRCVR